MNSKYAIVDEEGNIIEKYRIKLTASLDLEKKKKIYIGMKLKLVTLK